MEWYLDWEFPFLYWLQSLHNPVLDQIMIFITTLGRWPRAKPSHPRP